MISKDKGISWELLFNKVIKFDWIARDMPDNIPGSRIILINRMKQELFFKNIRQLKKTILYERADGYEYVIIKYFCL